MSISDHTHRVRKMRIFITTVDPSQRLIHAVGADGGAKQIAVFDVPANFVWPVEGEQWSAYEENGYWYLGNKFLDQEEDSIFTSMNPGDSWSMIHDQSVNVRMHGAKGDGVNDDTLAIQKAIDSASSGQDVYFPPGIYLISSPILLPHHCSIRGSNNQLWWENGDNTGVTGTDPNSRIDHPVCVIKVAPNFKGISYPDAYGSPFVNGAISMVDQRITGEDLPPWAGQIRRIGIEGDRQGTDVDGIQMLGQATDWQFEDIEIANMSGRGFAYLSYQYSPGNYTVPQNLSAHRCQSHNNADIGWYCVSPQDSTWIGCHGQHNGTAGWLFNGARHNEVIACKGEQNLGPGFQVQGNSEVIFIACRTDVNEGNGFTLFNQGAEKMITLVGCATYRDGHNAGSAGGGFAGISITGASGNEHGPVQIYGHSGTVGKGDDGVGSEGPQYGITAIHAPDVFIDGTFRGVTSGIQNLGSSTIRYGGSVRNISGTSGSPSGGWVDKRTSHVAPAIYGSAVTGVFNPSANQMRICRVQIPKTGVLRDLAVFIGTASGNIIGAIYDTQATRNLLWDSGSVAASGANAWQVIGDPQISVTEGDTLEFAVMADNATISFGKSNTLNSGASPLPSFPGLGAQAKFVAVHAAGSFAAPATIAEGSVTAASTPVVLVARIS